MTSRPIALLCAVLVLGGCTAGGEDDSTATTTQPSTREDAVDTAPTTTAAPPAEDAVATSAPVEDPDAVWEAAVAELDEAEHLLLSTYMGVTGFEIETFSYQDVEKGDFDSRMTLTEGESATSIGVRRVDERLYIGELTDLDDLAGSSWVDATAEVEIEASANDVVMDYDQGTYLTDLVLQAEPTQLERDAEMVVVEAEVALGDLVGAMGMSRGVEQSGSSLDEIEGASMIRLYLLEDGSIEMEPIAPIAETGLPAMDDFTPYVTWWGRIEMPDQGFLIPVPDVEGER